VLTKKQMKEVRQAALNTCYEDCQQNTDYLWQIVQSYIDSQNDCDVWEIISGDRKVATDILGFDPVTGQPAEEDDDQEETA
jgi:hypothetical protein